MILTMMMMIQKIYMSQMCDTCSFPVFQNSHCDGDDDDDDDGDDDDHSDGDDWGVQSHGPYSLCADVSL